MVKYCYRKAVNKMGKIIALVNQKGGVGKTTTSINLSASLGVLGKKVLLVDLDPQGNSTTGVGVDKGSKNKSIYDLLIDNATINEVIVKTKFKNLYIIPATINLAGANIELMEKSSLDPNFNKVGQLKKYLEQIRDEFDYIIIDCPPSLEILTTNALAAANSVIIPVQCEFFSLEGVLQLCNSIRIAKKNLNPTLDVEGVLLTMLDSRTILGLEVVEEVKNTVKNHKISGITLEIFETSITVADLEAAVKKDAEAKGLKGKELHIYVNAEERAAYYTADGEGSDDYKIDLTTL